MTKAYRDAIERGKSTASAAGCKWCDNFAHFHSRGNLEHLDCRLCGCVIAQPMPVGDQVIRRVKNQTFIQEKIQFTYLPHYREVLMEMNDGSKHVANLCADCAKRLDVSKLHALYAMDLAQWSSEGHHLGDAMCCRIPVRVLKVADYIRE